jgi:hypothetical protein
VTEGKSVIDDIERGKPARQLADQGEDRADHEPGLGERFHNRGHVEFWSLFRKIAGAGVI